MRSSKSVLLVLFFPVLIVAACRPEGGRGRVPGDVNDAVTRVTELIAEERYEQIYNESSALWKQDVTLDQSNETFKTLRTKLGRVESRTLNGATEQENSGGVLKGHVFILSYETHFELGDGMENLTFIKEDGRWLLARYFVNSTHLNR